MSKYGHDLGDGYTFWTDSDFNWSISTPDNFDVNLPKALLVELIAHTIVRNKISHMEQLTYGQAAVEFGLLPHYPTPPQSPTHSPPV